MHVRNIYRNPPNFAELAKKHTVIAPFLFLNSNGVPKINFKDQQALRALTKALLLEDFQLDVDIPENVLVPTVPLRLNYILWLEDLLSWNNGFGKAGDEVCGIDVGTGATAIYALLATKKNQWRMVGSEIEPQSVMLARSNVTRNNLEKLIQIRHVKDSVLDQVLADSSPNQYDFTMCNPPFFGNEDETDSGTKTKKWRPEPSGAKTGTKNELIYAGGELEFIFKMIEESKKHQNSVRIFTTMVGIKRDFKELALKLKSVGVKNFASTEFAQGKTMRWGLAWSFDDLIHLIPPPQVTHEFENVPGCLNFENYIFSHLQTLNFQCLKWISGVDEEADTGLETGQTIHFITTENTWTGQRRRRREMERVRKGNAEVTTADNNSEEPPMKITKLSNENPGPASHQGEAMEAAPSNNILLESHVQLVRDGHRGRINMRLLGGSLGKDGLNQIVTYLKNSYNRDAQNPSTELYQLLKC
ncbi:Methyltransferase-like protein 16 [Orchesella cincta]|uniref:U6 small nuclear RNA (adenine-(43)-N(6))-methyltransferase n=1 Tax=Orchesella cincta TaxID=48709 RepID=A0A1D2NDZ6_ORCCI|nr:Methyltransferase-like protein 16 [Orchesella cincta]